MAGCESSFRESRGAQTSDYRRVATRAALATLISLSSAVAAAIEPLRYYGFDETAYSPMARDGMHEIFAGHLFEIGIPIAGARMMMAAQANGFCKEEGLTVGTPERKPVGRVSTAMSRAPTRSGTERRGGPASGSRARRFRHRTPGAGTRSSCSYPPSAGKSITRLPGSPVDPIVYKAMSASASKPVIVSCALGAQGEPEDEHRGVALDRPAVESLVSCTVAPR